MNAIYRIALIALLAMGASACSKDYVTGLAPETLVVSSVSELSFAQQGETQEISFPAGDGSWRVDSESYDSSWVSVARDGNVLKVTALTNPNGLERRTELVVTMAGGKKVIPIFQYGTDISLRILENKKTVAFSKDGGSEALTIETNGTDWTVSTLGETESWYSYTIDKEAGKLTFSTVAMAEDDKDAKRSRRKTFYVSSGNRHLEISLVQRGYAQFQKAIPFNLDGQMTRAYVLAKEQELYNGTHYADLENAQQEWARENILLINSTGAQVSYAAYVFTNAQQTTLRDFYVKAHPRQTFDETSLIDWLTDEGYKKRDNVEERYMYSALAYYKEEDDRTSYYRIVNQADASFSPFIYVRESEDSEATTAQGAYMRYNESSNNLVLDEYGGMSSFPTNTNMIAKEGFTYEDVLAFEAKRGMIPAEATLPDGTENKITTVLNGVPGVPYAHILFRQKDLSDARGQLKYVIYSFNYAQADIDEGLSREPRLLGTVGKRIDHYIGNNIAFNVSSWTGTDTYYVQYKAQDALAAKAYSLARGDAEYGFYTYIRGDDDIINLNAGQEWFKVEYLKNKEFVALAKGRN